jgi:hypothetical protein
MGYAIKTKFNKDYVYVSFKNTIQLNGISYFENKQDATTFIKKNLTGTSIHKTSIKNKIVNFPKTL